MLKRFMLCIFASICFLNGAIADTLDEYQDVFKYVLAENGAIITGYANWFDGEIPSVLYLPTNLGGKPVIGIGKDAFETIGRDHYFPAFEIVVPEGIEYLEQGAFENCCDVTTIYFPSSLLDIPEGCFANVTAEIVFPKENSVFSVENGFLIDQRSDTLLYAAPSSFEHTLPSVERIGSRSIDNWLYEKTEVVLPSGVQSIGGFVFSDLPDISDITLPDSIKQIDSRAFWGTGLHQVVLSAGLIEIPPYCFCNCSLTSITIPYGVTNIGEYAFYYNWEMIETVTLPITVQFVGYNAFPKETRVIALSPDTHFETAEEYQLRCPNGELW